MPIYRRWMSEIPRVGLSRGTFLIRCTVLHINSSPTYPADHFAIAIREINVDAGVSFGARWGSCRSEISPWSQ